MRRYIRPKLGARKVASVTSRELDELHQALRDRPYQANRLVALLSKMFSLAGKWGWRADNPCKGIERFAESERDEWLKADQLGSLSKVLRAFPDRRAADALRLLILTGARRGEVLKATWDQFDLTRGVWTKPSHHTKQKKTEHVPLSGAARLLVSGLRQRAIKALGGEAKLTEFPFLFPGDAEGKPLQEDIAGQNAKDRETQRKRRLPDGKNRNACIAQEQKSKQGQDLDVVGEVTGDEDCIAESEHQPAIRNGLADVIGENDSGQESEKQGRCEAHRRSARA